MATTAAMRGTVYLFSSEGCPACAAAEPEFEKFKARNPLTIALKLDAFGPYPEHFGVRIKATPTYLLKLGDHGVVHVGTMKADAIEKWIKAYAE